MQYPETTQTSFHLFALLLIPMLINLWLTTNQITIPPDSFSRWGAGNNAFGAAFTLREREWASSCADLEGNKFRPQWLPSATSGPNPRKQPLRNSPFHLSSREIRWIFWWSQPEPTYSEAAKELHAFSSLLEVSFLIDSKGGQKGEMQKGFPIRMRHTFRKTR